MLTHLFRLCLIMRLYVQNTLLKKEKATDHHNCYSTIATIIPAVESLPPPQAMLRRDTESVSIFLLSGNLDAIAVMNMHSPVCHAYSVSKFLSSRHGNVEEK